MNFDIDHVSIQTNNFEKALYFYNNVLGFTIIKEPFSFKSRKLCLLKAGQIQIELYSAKSNHPNLVNYKNNRGGLDHIAFCVSDIFEAIDYFKLNGIKIIKEPFLPETNDKFQPLVSFIEGPDKQEIEIRENKNNFYNKNTISENLQ